MSSKNDIAFSIVVPIFNEEENLPELYRRLSSVMQPLCAQRSFESAGFEIILVDDGSSDSSWHIINELHKTDKRVTGLSLSRNFGHHVAISAGLDNAAGQTIIIMDGDLQDPPEEIPNFVAKLKEGYDLVFGVRAQRSDTLSRKVLSWLFWFVFKVLLKLDITTKQSMMRIMNRRYLDSFKRISEKNRFLAGLFAWTGFRQTSIIIKHDPRYAGTSKYNLWKMIKLTFNAVTSFSYLPLQLAGFLGMIIALISFLAGIFLIVQRFLYKIDVAGWASTMVSILFMGGVQLAFLGLIGEYIGRIFTEVQNRPLYLIKEILSDRVDDQD